jgi:hypothetical protein
MPRSSRLRGVVLATAVLATLFASPSASAAPRTGPPEAPDGTLAASGVEVMHAGDELLPNEWLESPNGDYALFVEPTGLLTVYGPVGPMWIRDDTETAVALVFQGDGNLVAYDASSQPLWASGTYAPGGALDMQNDGNHVNYRAGGVPVWASKSTPSFGEVPDRLLAGQQLASGQYLESDSGDYAAVMQGDGNLVIYGPAGPVWASGTAIAGTVLSMQRDGNLVAYRPNGLPAWHSVTNDWSGALLLMQDDGNLVIYRANGTPLWASASDPGVKVPRTTLFTGQRLSPGQSLVSSNGWYRLVMQTDGNLVVYGPRGAQWASGHAVPNSSLVNVRNGNVVVVNGPYSRASWQTASDWPYAGAEGRLVMQDDGNLVFYRNNGPGVWSNTNPRSWNIYSPLPSAPAGGWW